MQFTQEQMMKYARECTWVELEKEAAGKLQTMTEGAAAVAKSVRGAKATSALQAKAQNMAAASKAGVDPYTAASRASRSRDAATGAKTVAAPSPTAGKSFTQQRPALPPAAKPAAPPTPTKPGIDWGTKGTGTAATKDMSALPGKLPAAPTKSPAINVAAEKSPEVAAATAPRKPAVSRSTINKSKPGEAPTQPAAETPWHSQSSGLKTPKLFGHAGGADITKSHLAGAATVGGLAAAGTGYALSGNGNRQKQASLVELMYAARLEELEKEAATLDYLNALKGGYSAARKAGQGMVQAVREGHAAGKYESGVANAAAATTAAEAKAMQARRVAAAGGAPRTRPADVPHNDTPIGGHPPAAPWHQQTFGKSNVTYGDAAKVGLGGAALAAGGFGAGKMMQPAAKQAGDAMDVAGNFIAAKVMGRGIKQEAINNAHNLHAHLAVPTQVARPATPLADKVFAMEGNNQQALNQLRARHNIKPGTPTNIKPSNVPLTVGGRG